MVICVFVESCKTDSCQLSWLSYCLWSRFSRSFCASSSVKGHLTFHLLRYEMCKVLKSLMGRFLNSQVLKPTEGKHLLTVEYSKSDNLLSNSQIELGENTRSALSKLTTDQRKVHVALRGMKQFYVETRRCFFIFSPWLAQW